MKFSKKTLANGLRVVAVPMGNTETVSLLVLVGTGANYETKTTNGLSHFLEHMFFKGTKSYPKPGELDRMLDSVGALHNAFTSREETGYWIKVDAKHFRLALTFVSEIIQNALLKEEEIARERGVILEEMNMYWDAPQRYIWSILERLVFGDNPYGWDVIGVPHNIRTMKRSAFAKYWKSQYVAKNTVVVVSGNIKTDEVMHRIEGAFAGFRDGKFTKAAEPRKIIPGPRIEILNKNTAQTHLVYGAIGFPLEHKDRITADVLATILGGYMSSRLFSEIRERQGLAYSIHASHQAYLKMGYFAAYAGVPHGKAQEVVSRIISNLSRMRQSGPTSEELRRAKDNMKGRFAISLESTDEVASFVGEQEILLSRIRTPEDILKKIDKVAREDVQRTARALFREEKSYLAIIGPYQSSEDYKKILTVI